MEDKQMLKVGGQLFEVNKSQLIERSSYFKSLFEGDWKEKGNEVIEIKRSATMFAQILDAFNGYIDELDAKCLEELKFYGFKMDDEKVYEEEEIIENVFEEFNGYDNSIGITNSLNTLIALGEENEVFNQTLDLPTLGVYPDNIDNVYSIENYSTLLIAGDNTFTMNMERYGDMINDFSLLITLPALPMGSWWCNNIGYKLIKKVSLSIGGREILYRTGDYLEVENIFYFEKNIFALDCSEKMRKKLSLNPFNIHLPLRILRSEAKHRLFYSFPLISLQYHEMKIMVEINDYKELIEGNNNIDNINFEAYYLTQAILLNNTMRSWLVQTTQYLPINQVISKSIEYTTDGTNNQIDINLLDFNSSGLCKDFIIVIEDEEKKGDFISELKFLVNDQRYTLGCSMLKYEYPKKILGRFIPDGYYYLPFGFNPYYEYKSGFINLSRINRCEIKLRMKKSGLYKITVHCTRLNRLMINQGQGHLQFGYGNHLN